ncbi:MAG: hypothetical protein QXW00_02340 [Candidatus Woesearchaeota archaeon]
MKRRGVELSVNVIIIAIIALVVLVVLFAIFTGKLSIFARGTSNCQDLGGTCTAADNCKITDGSIEIPSGTQSCGADKICCKIRK